MSVVDYEANEVKDICRAMAEQICLEAQEQGLDINSTIHPFRVLAPYYLIDIEEWDDAISYIAIAAYNLSIHHISKNLFMLLKSSYLPEKTVPLAGGR